MEALEEVLELDKMKEYLSKFVVLFPGDHPSQLYPPDKLFMNYYVSILLI